MKKPGLAFVFNLLLAGAGLAYLGMWVWAVVNLAATSVIAYMVGRVPKQQNGGRNVFGIIAPGRQHRYPT
jgi:hypothetical protein